jgi:hypothetical protein
VPIKMATTRMDRLMVEKFMAILLGFLENINATLELPDARKFNQAKNINRFQEG